MTGSPSRFATFVVDADPAAMLSHRSVLKAHGYASVPCRTGEEFLSVFDPGAKSAVILDLNLPGMSGIELQSHLNEIGASTPVIVTSGRSTVSEAVQVMRNGALDFIEKPAPPDRLIDALKLSGDLLFDRPAKTPSKKVIADRLAKLTDRERDVLKHLLDGRLNKEIADDLGVSRRTVEVHRARIREKMHARGVADLVRMLG